MVCLSLCRQKWTPRWENVSILFILINYFNIPNEIYLFSINDIICSPSSELIPRLICFTLISLFPYLSIGCHNVIYFLYPHDAPLLFIYYFSLLHFSQFSSIHWYDMIYFKSKYQQCTVTTYQILKPFHSNIRKEICYCFYSRTSSHYLLTFPFLLHKSWHDFVKFMTWIMNINGML